MSRLDPRLPRGAASTPPLAYLAVGLIAGLIVAGLVSMFAWPSQDSAAAGGAAPGGDFGAGAPPSPVDITLAVEIIAAEPVELLATVAPVRESLVASEVDGLVVDLLVDEGSTVRSGQPLARLRTADVEQQLVAARASRDETDARLARAETDFQRLSSLLERRAISQREFDQATADRDALARAGERLQAEIARLEDQLSRSEIRAPFAGRIIAVSVEIGEWVGRGDPIAMLVDLSEVEIRMPIAERFIGAVEPGFPVTVRLDAIPGEAFNGVVRTIVPSAIPEARTFPVLVRIRNPGGRIKPGMAARVFAQLGDPVPTVLVSKDAVVRRGTETFVMTVVDGPAGSMVAQIPVVLGPARGVWQVILGGVMAGDRVIVRGNERVFPGQPVAIAEVRELPLPTADPDRPIALDPRSGGGA